MLLALSIIISVLTLVLLGFIAMANGMSDAPSAQIALWPWALGGFGFSALLAVGWWRRW